MTTYFPSSIHPIISNLFAVIQIFGTVQIGQYILFRFWDRRVVDFFISRHDHYQSNFLHFNTQFCNHLVFVSCISYLNWTRNLILVDLTTMVQIFTLKS